MDQSIHPSWAYFSSSHPQEHFCFMRWAWKWISTSLFCSRQSHRFLVIQAKRRMRQLMRFWTVWHSIVAMCLASLLYLSTGDPSKELEFFNVKRPLLLTFQGQVIFCYPHHKVSTERYSIIRNRNSCHRNLLQNASIHLASNFYGWLTFHAFHVCYNSSTSSSKQNNKENFKSSLKSVKRVLPWSLLLSSLSSPGIG